MKSLAKRNPSNQELTFVFLKVIHDRYMKMMKKRQISSTEELLHSSRIYSSNLLISNLFSRVTVMVNMDVARVAVTDVLCASKL
jgi:hypothetical protein